MDKSKAGYVPPEKVKGADPPFNSAQRPLQSRSSGLDTVSVLPSISTRLILCKKPLESLECLLSRVIEYRKIIAGFISKHLTGTDEHDFIMLCQIM